MESIIISILTNVGPSVVVVFSFLFWDYKKEQKRSDGRKEIYEKFENLVRENMESNKLLTEMLKSRPCLWKEDTKEFISGMKDIMENAVLKIVNGINGSKVGV